MMAENVIHINTVIYLVMFILLRIITKQVTGAWIYLIMLILQLEM
jgi:hypothetical protein